MRAAQDRFQQIFGLLKHRHMIYYGWAIIAPRSMPSETYKHVAGMSDIDAAFFLRRIGVSSAETGTLDGASCAFELGHLQDSAEWTECSR